jgi:hypothetical protein
MPDQLPQNSCRNWLRLSVRGLIILVLMIGGGLGLWLNHARRRLEAVAAIERLGAKIGRDCILVNKAWVPKRPSSVMRLLRIALGDAPFEEVKVVDLDVAKLKDSDLAFMETLHELDTLSLSFTTVGDPGLRHLRDLRSLRQLYLEKTMVTDAGLVHLEGLDCLETLALSGTQVSDAGLVHLKGMKRLKLLAVLSSRVTDEGAAYLATVLPNVRVVRGEW